MKANTLGTTYHLATASGKDKELDEEELNEKDPETMELARGQIRRNSKEHSDHNLDSSSEV